MVERSAVATSASASGTMAVTVATCRAALSTSRPRGGIERGQEFGLGQPDHRIGIELLRGTGADLFPRQIQLPARRVKPVDLLQHKTRQRQILGAMRGLRISVDLVEPTQPEESRRLAQGKEQQRQQHRAQEPERQGAEEAVAGRTCW